MKRVYVLTQLSEDEEGNSVFVAGIYETLEEARKNMQNLYQFELFDAEDSGYEPDKDLGFRHAYVRRSENWAEKWQIHTVEI